LGALLILTNALIVRLNIKMFNFPRLIVAGVKGGSGKTTVTLSIISAFGAKKNLKVIPYKKGPDYIDAGWLSKASQNPCYNLDPFLVSKDKVLESFISHYTGDIAVIEGNRGLYDGMDMKGSFSTAELSKLIKSPVILVVDCTKITRTAAAIVKGCMDFDKDVRIKAVILNQVSSKRHESIIRESIENYCRVPVLGVIPRLKEGEMPERHMGLTPYQEHPDFEQAMNMINKVADKHLDIEGILNIACDAEPLIFERYEPQEERISGQAISVKIGVLRDTAFQFYYPENLEELINKGAQIVDINALSDTSLPEIDALYIGGGFPETNAIRLAENRLFRESVKNSAKKGLPIYAECGGLMFLGEKIRVGGNEYPMVGLLPVSFEMKRKPQAHGYTIAEVDKQNPFYPVGTVLHGHEFHYSAVREIWLADDIHTAFLMQRGKGVDSKRDGICYKNTLAAYTHIHALGVPAWSEGLIRKSIEYKLLKGKVN
jgi:cobyrinic acid a,c-diamide synthase